MNRGRAQIFFYILTALALAVGLSILVWLHQRYERDRVRSLEDMQRFFTRDEVLKPPQDINLRFATIESLARKFEATLFVQRLYVSKIVDGKGEWLVHPFYLPAIEPDWKKEVAGWTRLPLVENGEPYGALYVLEDRAALQGVRWAIGVLAALLLLTLSLLTLRLVVQQSALHGAHIALAEKDRQMVRLERLALAGQLSANIFHDIKKPVANIKHSLADLEMIMRDLAGGSPALRNIREQTDLFFTILRDLGLERFVRAKDSDKEYVDLHDILRRSCALAQYERGKVEINWDLDKTKPPLVLAPPYRLIQVFSNLTLNAYQAMNGEGKLTFRTHVNDGRVMAEVVDTGPGVAPPMRARLFEPFESSKPEDEGTGLGLYISRSIIEELGGSLRLGEAEAGGATGARFVVELPVAGGPDTP